MQFGLGYDPAMESRHEAAMSRFPRLTCAPSAPLPAEVDPRGKLRCNNQFGFSSCCGNAKDKIMEFCNLIAAGVVVNLSARFSYLTTKMVDGTINGGDAGASISGATLASQQYGECEESVFPYFAPNERYSNRIPDEAFARARDHRARSATQFRNWDEARTFIGSGQGGMIFGITWTSGLANFRGKVLTMDDLGGSYLGEHAVCDVGYFADGDGLMYNSHGEGWGDDGTAKVDQAVLDYWWKRSRHGFYGISDLPTFGQRKLKSWGAMT